MKFWNELNEYVATVFVYRQDDSVALISAWHGDVSAGYSRVYKPVWGDEIEYKAKVRAYHEEHWVEHLKDKGQYIKIKHDGDYGFKLETGND